MCIFTRSRDIFDQISTSGIIFNNYYISNNNENMAAKKQTRSKTRTSTKKQGFKFRWWMGVLLVLVIAVVGVAVLRFSQAAAGSYTWYYNNPLSTAVLAGFANAKTEVRADENFVNVVGGEGNQASATIRVRWQVNNGNKPTGSFRGEVYIDGQPAYNEVFVIGGGERKWIESSDIRVNAGSSLTYKAVAESGTPTLETITRRTINSVPFGGGNTNTNTSSSSGGSRGTAPTGGCFINGKYESDASKCGGGSGGGGGSTRRQVGCDVLLSNGVTIFVPYTGNCNDGYAAQEAVRIYYASRGSGSASAAKAPAPVQCDPYKSNCDDANWVTWDGVPSHIYTYKKRYYLQKCYSKEGSGSTTRYINEKPCPSLDSGNFRLKLPSTGSFTQLNQFITGNFGFIRRSFPMSPDPQVENCSIQFKAQGGGCQLRNNTIKIKSDWLGIPAPNNNKKICVYTSGLTKADALNNKLAVRIIASNGSTVGILKPQYQPVLSGDGRTYQAYCQDLRGKADYKQADIYVEGSEFGMPTGAENAKAIEYWSWPQ